MGLMAKKKPRSAAVGDWFAVPLHGGRYAVGRVVRSDGQNRALGYFFGPALPRPPLPGAIVGLRPTQAALVARFSDVDIVNGEWPIISTAPVDFAEWPIPAFRREDPLDETRAYEVRYTDQLTEASAKPLRGADGQRLPDDGFYGAGAIQRLLAHRLGLST